MRVIAGVHRGRKLIEVEGETTRPTTDKNKEKLFNILGQYFDGGLAIDLFSGSGALGIESISRGMGQCLFIDLHPKAVATIKQNLKTLKIEAPTAKVELAEALLYLRRYQGFPFDLVLLDPPYQLNIIPEILTLIASRQLLTKTGVIVCENEKKTTLPEKIGSLFKHRESIEGITKFTFYLWEESL